MADSNTENELSSQRGNESASYSPPKSPHLTNYEIDEIAKNLLDGKFYLTALEFHAELVEEGRELARFKDFFSNPGNFEMQMKLDPFLSARKSPSVLTLDSIDDFARYSDDGLRDTDEKVTVLEFELRKAKETIHELRQSITQLTADKKEKEDTKTGSVYTDGSINQYEIRSINFLINEYLLKRNYKLTSITFADEVADQDLDDWEDVGLNTVQPPDILRLLHDYSNHVIDPVKLRNEELLQLKKEIGNLTKKCDQLQNSLSSAQQESLSYQDQLEELKNTRLLHVQKQQRYKFNDEDNVSLKSNSSNKSDSSSQNKNELDVDKVRSDTLKNVDNTSLLVETTDQSNKIIDISFEVPTMPTQNKDLAIDKEEDVAFGNITENKEIDVEQTDSVPLSAIDRDRTNNLEILEDGNQLHNKNLEVSSGTFLEVLFLMTQNREETQISKKETVEESMDPVYVISKSLPNIVPNVLLNKREELIPLILCAVRHHEDPAVRDELLHSLFNLIKRPDKNQRRIIIDGCVNFAKSVEPVRIEAEFLPQCWEQMGHKFVERRLLVAETCGCIALYVPVHLVSSLIFSMLSQMLQDDRSEDVRCAVTKAFALICGLVNDSSKYTQAFSLLEVGLNDIVEAVVKETKTFLVPVVAVWSLKIKKLQTHFQTQLLNRCYQSLQSWHEASTTQKPDEMDPLLLSSEKKFNIYIECLINTVTVLFAGCLLDAPFADNADGINCKALPDTRLPPMKNKLLNIQTLFGDEQKVCYLVTKFDDTVKHETWESLSWICGTCIWKTCEISVLTHGSIVFIEKIVCYLFTVCKVFGIEFTYAVMVPYFEKLMRNTGVPFLNDIPPVCSPLVTLFLCGVLAVHQGEEQEKKLLTFLKQCLITISTQALTMQYLTLSVEILSKTPNFQLALIQMLRETIVYPVAEVRVTACHLFEVLVKYVGKDILSSQVAPAIISLSNDRDRSVRVAAVPALGNVVGALNDKSLLDKVSLQFQMLLEDSTNQLNIQIILIIIKTFTKMIPNVECWFRDEFLIPRLKSIAENNSLVEDLADRTEIAEELIHAVGAVLCCFLAREVIATHVLPTLKFLEADLKDVRPETLDSVVLLMRDAESKLEDDKSSTGSGASLSTSSKLFSGLSSRLDKLKKKR